jgi:long-chain acyl-CoA synthetase
MELVVFKLCTLCTGKLEKFETPAAVKLCSEVWSPDMGLVTAAFKLKRKDIQDRYQHEINRMYAS